MEDVMYSIHNEVSTVIENAEDEEHIMEQPDFSVVGMDNIWYDSLGD